MKNKINKILIIAADGFEETELVVPYDLWIRYGYQCNITALKSDNKVLSNGGISINAKNTLSELLKSFSLEEIVFKYDLIFLPGGPGFLEYLKSEVLKQLVKLFLKTNNKFVSAICAAPMVLDEWAIIKNKKISVFPAFATKIKYNFVQLNNRVTIDGNLITGQNPAAVFDFALKVIEVLNSKEDALNFKKIMTL